MSRNGGVQVVSVSRMLASCRDARNVSSIIKSTKAASWGVAWNIARAMMSERRHDRQSELERPDEGHMVSMGGLGEERFVQSSNLVLLL